MKKKELFIQIFKFLIVGGIATLIDWVIYFILYNLGGINPLLANVVSFFVSVVYNYIASVKWVFKINKEKTKKQLFIEFMIFSILGLILTEILLWIFIDRLKIGKMIAKIIATGIVMIFNFVTRKIFLEDKINFNKVVNNRKFKVLKNLFYAGCFIIGINYYFFKGFIFGRQSIFNIILLVGIYEFLRKNEVKNEKVSLIFSIIFVTSLVVGKIIFDTNDISKLWENFKILVLNVITWIGFIKVFNIIFEKMFFKIKRINEQKDGELWKLYQLKNIFWILLGIIVISRVPVFLAYFPGIYSCDINVQTNQIFTNSITKWHPPIHTYFWQFCLMIGDKINIDALIIYSWIQILFLAIVFAKVIHFLIKKKVNNWIILFAILFFTLNPVIHIYSLITTKDVCFAGFMILFILEGLSLLEDPKEYLKRPLNWLKYCFLGIMTCLFRNNAVYAIILTVPFFIYFNKKYWLKMGTLFLIIIGGYLFVQNNVYDYLGVKEGNNKEMLSVPMEQIANVVYHNSELLTVKEQENIEKFMSYDAALNKYNPRFADPVKSTFKTNYFNNHKIEFIKLWGHLLVKYPVNYVSAFLSLNLNYWYIDANTLDSYTKKGYLEDYFYQNEYYTTKRESKLPWLYKIYHKVATFKLFEKVPLVEELFSVTTIFWFLMVTIFALLYRRQYKLIVSIIPLFFLWLTHMAGPISSFRYMFVLYCSYPIFMAYIFKGKCLLKGCHT